jgi:hypothetical protein
VHISTPESLQHAQDARFHVQECHVEIRNALTQLHSLAASPLAERLRSITLSDWSVVHSGILLWIQTAADEGESRLSYSNFQTKSPISFMQMSCTAYRHGSSSCP